MAIPLGRFALEAPLAKGGMGVVWRAVEPRQRLPVAIKLVSSELADDPDYVESFHREVRAVARLDHPGIIQVHDFGVVDAAAASASGGRLREGTPYLAMEHVSSTLAAQVRGLDWPHLRHIVDELLDALAHAHARGVIHRDLKPQNLLVATARDERPGLKLTDFGIAQALGEQMGERSGTPAYMAPEQIVGTWRDLGPWTDLYALGCVVWRLATGTTPFGHLKGKELFRAHVRDEPGEFRPRFAMPEEVELWLRRLLAKKPQKRFLRAHQAKDILAMMVPAARPVRATTLIPSDEHDLHEMSTIKAVSLGQRQKIPPDWRESVVPVRRGRALTGLGLFGLRVVPLVGREEARDRIWKALHASRDRRELTVVGFTGPEGAGRTRLLDWAAERSHEIGGFDTLRIRCSEEGDPLGRALDELHLTAGLGRAERAERLASVLTRVDARARDGVLDVLSHIPVPEESLPTFRALAIEAVAQERRLLLTFDDLHASPEMQAFLAFLKERQAVRPSPIAAVVAARSGFVLPGVELAELGPLSTDDRHHLLHDVLSLSEPLADRAGERSRGNPGHMVQIVGQWVRGGQLLAEAGGYALAPDATIDAPSTEAAWSERLERVLDGLPAFAGEVLELAAVLGVHVDEGQWQHVSDDPRGESHATGYVSFSPKKARVRAALYQRLLNDDLARETEDGWAFRHAGFREAVLERARDAGRLASHHRACAVALNASFADEKTTGSIVGAHLLGAGVPGEALDLLLRSVEPALQRYGPAQALNVVSRCEDARRAAGIAANDRRALQIQVERARLLQLSGNSATAAPLAEEAREAARAEGIASLAAEACLVLACCHIQLLEWLAAERVAREGLELLADTRRPRLAASLQTALSEAREQLPGRDAVAPLLQARTAMRRMAGEASDRMRLELDTRICRLQRDHEGAAAHAEAGVAMAKRSNDLRAQHRFQALQGAALRALGQFDAAEAAMTDALETSRLLGDSAWPGHLAQLLMAVYRHRGAGAASTVLRREARATRRLDDGPLHVPLHIASAAIKAWEGELDVAEKHIAWLGPYGDSLEASEDNWIALSDAARRLEEARRPGAVVAWRLAQNVAEFARNRDWLRQAREGLGRMAR